MRQIIYLIMFLCMPLLAYAALNSSITAYYNLNETTGMALDSIGSIHIPEFGTVPSLSGKISNARGVFSGTNYFSTSNNTLGNGSTSQSISFWFYLNGSSTGTRQFIVSSGDEILNIWNFAVIYDSSGDRLFIRASNIAAPCTTGDQTTLAITKNVWHHAVFIRNNTLNTLYIDGVVNKSYSDSGTCIGRVANFTIGRSSAYNYGFQSGFVDEVGVYNRALDSSEVNDLYNSGNGFSYPFIEYVDTTPSYNITTVKNPVDLNSTFTGIMTINGTVTAKNEYANFSLNNNSFMMLNFSINSGLWTGCNIYYGKNKCYSYNAVGHLYNMTKINNSLFSYSFDDNDYYPSIYPYDYGFIDDNPGSNRTVYLNNYIKYNIFNLSTNAGLYFIDVEFDASNLSDNAMSISYCNSSYSSGNPLTDNNCELVDYFLPINFTKHLHNFSSHYAVPMRVSIQKTQVSYIIFMSTGNIANGWKFRYVTNSSYDNSSFNYGSYNTWPTTSDIYDIHLHEFQGNDYMSWKAIYYDGNGYTNISAYSFDWYNITNYAPSAPSFINPVEGTIFTIANSQNTSLYISWTNSSDVNNDSFTYNLYTYDGSFVKLGNFSGGNWYFNWSTNNNETGEGTYQLYMLVCDIFDNCDISLSSDISFCSNDWQFQPQPCTGGVTLISYYDANGCPEYYDYPSDNGTYTNCTYTQELDIVTDDLEDYTAKMFILIFMSLLFFTMLKYSINSSGLFKLLYVFCGFLLIMIALLINGMVDDILTFSSTIYLITYRLFILSLFIIGIGLIPLGIYETFRK